MKVGLYQRALDSTEQIIARVNKQQMDNPTPCPDWTVRHLLNHIVSGNLMFARAAKGDPPSLGGEDLIGADALLAYRASVVASKSAWNEATDLKRSVELPHATVRASMALSIAFVDNLVHGWDIAKATGQDATIDPELATAALAIARVLADAGRGSHYGPAIPTPPDAPPSDRLVAVLGRQP